MVRWWASFLPFFCPFRPSEAPIRTEFLPIIIHTFLSSRQSGRSRQPGEGRQYGRSRQSSQLWKSELNHFCQSSPAKEISELNRFLPTEGRNHLKDGNWKGVKSSLFSWNRLWSESDFNHLRSSNSTAGKSDFNHSENPHNAPCEQAQKVRNIYIFSLLHYLRFVSALFAFRFPAE